MYKIERKLGDNRFPSIEMIQHYGHDNHYSDSLYTTSSYSYIQLDFILTQLKLIKVGPSERKRQPERGTR